ncbi:hypothetical protein K490DRAFT_48919 [Saccharata proteae CBS 121410]|uniref:Vacuolar protein sorting-associated protein 51 homolog n=1 Tax=Saccharata proteae CBS 121410 TaxID=1314787 RepID=A0A9P4HMU3_9PEZI|nr:hypothetical protein K490DRAFT_48919 [Saccharata proteae CBS 121410]
MSTIASPRPSSSIRSPSSTRTSIDTARPSTTTNTRRRDRAALRDYYNLKAAAPVDAAAGSGASGSSAGEDETSELDREGFDAAQFVRERLAKEGLEGVLRCEAGLVGQIRGLDGERKALVYDNYSKLIAATDTIRKMRTNMDPLTPTTSTLSPAISHIAETASALSASIAEHAVTPPRSTTPAPINEAKEKQKQTVRWVLDTPRRLREKLEKGEREGAEREWEVVGEVLGKWKGVDGVDALKRECEGVLKRGNNDG